MTPCLKGQPKARVLHDLQDVDLSLLIFLTSLPPSCTLGLQLCQPSTSVEACSCPRTAFSNKLLPMSETSPLNFDFFQGFSHTAPYLRAPWLRYIGLHFPSPALITLQLISYPSQSNSVTSFSGRYHGSLNGYSITARILSLLCIPSTYCNAQNIEHIQQVFLNTFK